MADPVARADGVRFVDIDWAGRPVRIEHEWIGPERAGAPLIVFLHEGLGSLSAWRSFPRALCSAAGARGLVYSRPGYGQSAPPSADEIWDTDYMHRQAHEVLPALLHALGIDARRDPPWLFGHSDGGSIALLYAAHFADCLAGAVVVAPHVMVEDLSVQSIAKTREAYRQTDLPARLAKHHADADTVFWRWNRIWLHPPFRHWSIEAELDRIACPLLAVQGIDDEYGTLDQIHRIRAHRPATELLELPACGHAVHKDQTESLIAATAAFMQRHPASFAFSRRQP